MLTRVRTLTSRLIDFCYPRVCLACDASLDETSTSALSLCDDCSFELAALQAAPFCDRCGMPVVELDDPCAHCQGKGVPHFERVIRLGVFDDPLKHLIHQMKYHRRWPIAEMLARKLVDHEPVKALLSETDVLVPVPLHPFRQISRGFNQAEVIAKTIGRICRLRIVKPLVRARRTPMQTSMPSSAQRMQNMRDAFLLVDGKRIRNKHVVLIDDVMTTGATLQSAARALVDAKPASLCTLTIAIADPKHRNFQSI